MKQEEFKQLEILLGKLGQYLGHDFCITSGVIQDGYCIGLYNDKGNLITQDTWVDIESTAARVKERVTIIKV